MPGQVALVTDSTAYLPRDWVERYAITVVPVQVVIGGMSFDEGEVESAAIIHALRAGETVTTSRPNPQAFAEAYAAAAEAGATSVVSVHLSAEMSGTVDSARVAAVDAPLPVHVVDSRAIAMALGFGVLAGAHAAEYGQDGDEVTRVVTDRCEATRSFFYVDTLEYLRRGGRIGPAAAMLGSALAVKPLLHLDDGRIAPLEKVRTASRAIARLQELAVEAAGDRPVDVAVQHLDNAARAEEIGRQLKARIPDVGELVVEEVGAVVGCHVGPGLLAVAVSPR
jgi:DegV family protein with EDD domain